MRVGILTIVLAGCTGPATIGPMPVYDPAGAGFFDTPWPNDARTIDGYPDLDGFPNPSALPLLEQYVAVAAAQVGFGTNAPIYLRFAEAIDTGLLPDPQASLGDDSPLILVDVDPASPFRGERFPVMWEFQPLPASYRDANQLAVAPLLGFPLRPRTTYALVVTTGIAQHHDGFAEVWDPSHPQAELYAPLGDWLDEQGIDTDEVAIATVFSTTDPVAELARLADYIDTVLEPAALGGPVATLDSNVFYRSFESSYSGPLFQHGERPYASEGGGFRFDSDGTPEIATWETIRIAISTPKGLSNPPPGGWPVVIFADGTGSDYRTFCDDSNGLEVAAQLAHAGLVGIGFDQPLHGTRATEDTNTDLHTFNYLNPESSRANFRQGALDILYLAKSLEQGPIFTTDDGTPIPIDPQRILYMGHSQGGLTGALAAPFLDVEAVMLSGAGGNLSITIVERKDPYDIAALLTQVLGLQPQEQITEMHPVVGLVQTLIEVTDPINYSPFWFSQDGGFGGAPRNVLLTSGLHDEQTPHRSAEALASAARLPRMAPAANDPIAFQVRSLPVQTGPLTDNVEAWDGSQVTAALVQWPDDDHFAVFDNADAAVMYGYFLETSAYGTPTIHPNPPF